MLTARQNLLIRAQLAIAQKLGPWRRDVEADGAGYIGPEANAGFEQGFACGNCVFFQPGNRCAIVKGRIDEGGLCRFHVIPNDRLTLGGAQAALGRVVGEVDLEEVES